MAAAACARSARVRVLPRIARAAALAASTLALAATEAPAAAKDAAAGLVTAATDVPLVEAPVLTPCERYARSGWPLTVAARAALRDEMEAGVKECLDSAPYLALLGALWLESGEARQALLWLERSLLLDPAALGARADHALALAALGESAAREALIAEWQDRSDVPPALMRRLRGKVPPTNGETLAAASGSPRWLRRGEVALRFGYDSNLDRVPVLDSITLTPQEGAVELPLAVPFRPRSGSTAQLDFGWRLARDSGANTLWQVSLAAAARHSPHESGTDWYYTQGRAEYWLGAGVWRGQAYGSLGRSAGPLSEPYVVRRFGLAGERDFGRCVWRAAFEGEQRRQHDTRRLDGDVTGFALLTQCPLDRRDTWRGVVEVRHALDKPVDPDRPGGRQRQTGLTLRLGGSVLGVQLDGSLTYVDAQDSELYSPLLAVRRRFRQSSFNVDAAYSLRDWLDPGAHLLLQWGAYRQSSNIPLFTHQGHSVSLGLRWRW